MKSVNPARSRAEFKKWLAATACFAAAFGVGLFCAFPTFAWGDHPQYLLAARGMESVETGYGLFLSLLRLFMRVPELGGPFLSNVFSALCAALASAIAFLFAKKRTGSVWVGICWAAAFWAMPVLIGFSRWGGPYSTLWLFGVGFAACLEAHLDGSRGDRMRWGLLAAGVGAAGVAHHPAIAILAIIGGWMSIRSEKISSSRAAQGFLPFLFVASLASCFALWPVLRPLRQAVWTLNFTGSPADYYDLKRAGLLATNIAWLEFVRNAAWELLKGLQTRLAPLSVLAVIGFGASYLNPKRRTGAWILAVPLAVAMFAFSGQKDGGLMTTIAFLGLFPLALGGARALLGPKPGAVRSGAVGALALAQACLFLAPNIGGMNQSRNDSAKAIQQAMLEALEPNGILVLLDESDPLAGIAYLQEAEGVRADGKVFRPDLLPFRPYRDLISKTLADVAGVGETAGSYEELFNNLALSDLKTHGETESLAGKTRIFRKANLISLFQLLDANWEERPVFFNRIETLLGASDLARFAYGVAPPLFKNLPGAIYQLKNAEEPVFFRVNEIPASPPGPNPAMLAAARSDATAKQIYSSFYLDAGQFYYDAADLADNNPGWLQTAVDWLEAGLQIYPDSGKMRFLIGSIQQDRDEYDKARESLLRAKADIEAQLDRGEYNANLLYMLSEIHMRLGDREAARRALKRLGENKERVVKSDEDRNAIDAQILTPHRSDAQP